MNKKIEEAIACSGCSGGHCEDAASHHDTISTAYLALLSDRKTMDVLLSKSNAAHSAAEAVNVDSLTRLAKVQSDFERLKIGKRWSFCPECGSEKNERLSDFKITHRECMDCGQEWHWDIDYMEVVRGHLAALLGGDKIKSALETKADETATKECPTFPHTHEVDCHAAAPVEPENP